MKAMRTLLFGLLSCALLAISGAQETHVRVGGTYEDVDEIHVQISSTWEDVQEGWIRVGGSWEQFFQRSVVTVSGEGVSDTDGFFASASIVFNSSGIVEKIEGPTTTQVDSATDWIIPNSASSGPKSYHIRATLDSGDTPTGTLNTWLPLSSTRTWGISSGSGTNSCSLTIEISDDGGTTTLDSATYTLSATV